MLSQSTYPTILHTQGLSQAYNPGKASEVIAESGLDLQVPRNAIFGFIGPNGAGKARRSNC